MPLEPDPRKGRDEIREFYSILRGTAAQVELGLYDAVDDRATFTFTIQKKLGFMTICLQGLDVMEFAADGKVQRMFAHWSCSDMALC